MGLSTHVLDTAMGKPAAGLPIKLEKITDDGSFTDIGEGTTNTDGRLASPLIPEGQQLEAVTYRITFDTGAYFRAQEKAPFYPLVQVVFTVPAAEEHYHIPLLLSPFGYSTYRGS
jgi:5-hydroxyisourate hydrolase